MSLRWLDGWWRRAHRERADRARTHQLEYQRRKAASLRGHEDGTAAGCRAHALRTRVRLERLAPIPDEARVLEVGSGAHGLIFWFGGRGVGIDPLAHEYASLFPAWQRSVPTCAAEGEALPFRDGAFDVVLSDNVIDHARDPGRIVAEMVRVLAPGGLFYLTVNTHHPLYEAVSTAYGAWRSLGGRLEIAPFAHHTVHLTPGAARALVRGLPLRVLEEAWRIDEARRIARRARPRHLGDRLKRAFYKNALLEVVARREPV